MDGLPFREWLSEYSDDVIFRTQQHLLLSLYCVALAAVVGMALALLTYRRAFWANVNIGVVAILFTIPSVALFGFLISVMGQPLLTLILAISMYSLLPIVRNTVVGLQTADPNVIDAAKGMGVGPFRMLWQIRFPIAWPIILAGLRVATQLAVGLVAIGAFVGDYGLGDFGYHALDNLGSVNTKNEAIACVLFVALVALFFDACFVLVRRFTTPRGARRA